MKIVTHSKRQIKKLTYIRMEFLLFKQSPIGIAIIITIIILMILLRKQIKEHGGYAGKTILGIRDIITSFRFFGALVISLIFAFLLFAIQKTPLQIVKPRKRVRFKEPHARRKHRRGDHARH